MPTPATARLPLRLLATQSDGRLVDLARAGHERAFEVLVQRYRKPLLGYLRRRLRLPEARAEDALQQAFLAAWLALQRGTEVKDAGPWLYRIAHNTAVSGLRRGGHEYEELTDACPGADAPEADVERRRVMRETLVGLAALPELQREGLLRTAIAGQTYERAASELQISEPALRGLLYRARVALRAAATAFAPAPVVSWLASGGRTASPLATRLAEAVAGAGRSAGLAGLVLQGGAVVVSAGALMTGPGLLPAGGQAQAEAPPAVALAGRGHIHSTIPAAGPSRRLPGPAPGATRPDSGQTRPAGRAEGESSTQAPPGAAPALPAPDGHGSASGDSGDRAPPGAAPASAPPVGAAGQSPAGSDTSGPGGSPAGRGPGPRDGGGSSGGEPGPRRGGGSSGGGPGPAGNGVSSGGGPRPSSGEGPAPASGRVSSGGGPRPASAGVSGGGPGPASGGVSGGGPGPRSDGVASGGSPGGSSPGGGAPAPASGGSPAPGDRSGPSTSRAGSGRGNGPPAASTPGIGESTDGSSARRGP